MKRKLTLIINGMFYGDPYTKRMLWSVFFLSVFTVGAVISGLALSQWVCYVIAAVLAAIDLYLIFSIHLDVAMTGEEEVLEETQEEVPEKEEPKKEEKPAAVSSEKKETPVKKAEPLSGTEQKITSEKELKQVFHKYKVKKNHRPVLVDASKIYHIKECPAYIWTHHGQLHMLLLEDAPRKVTIPLSKTGALFYEKSVPANQKVEYECLNGPGLIPFAFSEYRPVYQTTIVKGQQREVKNLYRLGEDLLFTAPSVKELLTLLQPELVVNDDVMQSDEFNQYFKQIYKQKILLNDGAQTMKQYQTKVKKVLTGLSEAAITPAAFRMTISDMLKFALISPEYANYYTQLFKQRKDARQKEKRD